MGRPEKNTVDYFPHPAEPDTVLFYIHERYGNDGYVVYHAIKEKICKTEYHFINLKSPQELMYLMAKTKVSESVLMEILNDLAKFDEIDEKLWKSAKIVWWDKLVEGIKYVYVKRNNKCITKQGLILRLAGLGILKKGFRHPDGSSNTRIELNRIENNISARARPKDEQEVEAYMTERKKIFPPAEVKLQAAKFMSHHQSKGWRLGRTQTPMKDWQAAVRTWESNWTKFNRENQTEETGPIKVG